MKFLMIVVSFVENHKIALGLLTTAFIKVMPIPGEPWTVYVVIYDTIHQYLNFPNLRLAKLTQPAIPSPPASASIPEPPLAPKPAVVFTPGEQYVTRNAS